MINIQKSHLVHISSIRSILSSSVYIGLIGPFDPIQSILSTKVLFIPLGLIQSTLALFSPYWSYFVHIGSIQSILSISVLFSPHWSYSVQSIHFSPIGSHSVYPVHFSPIQSIRSYSVHLVPIRMNIFNNEYILQN